MSTSSTASEVLSNTFNIEELYHGLCQELTPSSTPDPPRDEWSSYVSLEDLEPHVDPPKKKVLNHQGLYDSGGETCAAYIPLADSDVCRHLYYKYPSVKDPGILDALYKKEKKGVYGVNGQDLYLDLCEEMGLIPVRKFHQGLLKRDIDLRYYGINPRGVRAMCEALTLNDHVRRLDLTSNYLDDDACYHLGQLLAENATLTELILSQCNLKPGQLKKIVYRLARRPMEILDLSRNHLEDKGFEFLAEQIAKGAVIRRLNLSYNDLTSISALSFAAAIEGNTSITHLDLSWNKLSLSHPKGIDKFLRQLGDSDILTELYLSWNALTSGSVLRKLFCIPTLRILDLSNNRLSTSAAKAVNVSLHMARSLQTLDLSHNPFSPTDALLMLQAMRKEEVVLKNLFLDDVIVEKEFVAMLREILQFEYRANAKITYGFVTRNYDLTVPDLSIIVMRRLYYLVDSTEECKMDIILWFLNEYKIREEPKLLQPQELMQALKKAKAPLDEGLIEELTKAFPGPMIGKGVNTILLQKVVDCIRRLWPEKELPPTPSKPPPKPKIKKGKGRAKKNKKCESSKNK